MMPEIIKQKIINYYSWSDNEDDLIAACRIGIHAYADAIKDHLPELSNDLKTKYPLL